MIREKLGHGITTYKGESGFGKHGETTGVSIIYTVLTRLALNRLKAEIEKIDDRAL